MLGYINLGRHLVFERFKPALSLLGPGTLIFVVMIQASNFGADAYHSIKHRGFRVLSTLDSTVTICHCGKCFSPFHSTLLEGDRAARGRSLFQKKNATNHPEKTKRLTTF